MIGPAASALLAETRRKPGRLLLTGLAITVATIFAAGTLLFSETLRAHLTQSLQPTPAGATVVVSPYALTDPGSTDRASADDPDGEIIRTVRSVEGVADVTGVWSTGQRVLGAGPGTTWEVRSDPMRAPLSRLHDPVQGRLPASANEVAVGEATAQRHGIALGTPLTLAAGEPRPVTVTGIVRLQGEWVDTLVGSTETVVGLGGSLDQVDVAAAPGVEASALADRIGTALGSREGVRTGPEQRADEAESASSSVDAILVGVGVFAGLAVVAAAVVVASTFRIVLTQRRTQLALLRCVGARRGQVIGAVLAEAVVSGLVAGVLGVGGAVLAGHGLLAALRFGGSDVPSLVLWWPGLAAVLLVAVLSTVLAAVAPALAAARIAPLAALGSAASGETGVPRAGRRLVLAGLIAAAAAAMAALALAVKDDPEIAFVGIAASGMVAFAALVAAGPLLVRGLGATVGRLVAALGRAPGRLAVANANEVPRRTAAAVSVLALGVGLTSALLVAIASIQADVEDSLSQQFPTDIVVTASEPADAAALAARLAGDPRLAVRSEEVQVFVDPAQGVDGVAARTAVEQAAAGGADLRIEYAGDVRAEVESALAVARAIGLGLVGMTALVAVVGVGVTLMLSVTERTRETGLLRAVGLTRPGVRAMVAWEAAMSGAGAAVVGAVIGAGYGLLGVEVIGLGGSRGLTPASLPPLALLVVGVVAVAMLAGLIPAVRAGQVPPIRALQDALS